MYPSCTSPGWLTSASLAFNGRPSKYHLLQHTMYSTTTCKPQRSHKNLFFANMNIRNVLTDLHWFRENSSDLGLTSIQAPHAFQLSVEEPHRRRPSSNRSGCFNQPIFSKKQKHFEVPQQTISPCMWWLLSLWVTSDSYNLVKATDKLYGWLKAASISSLRHVLNYFKWKSLRLELQIEPCSWLAPRCQEVAALFQTTSLHCPVISS